MPTVVLQISYEIDLKKRAEYLALVSEMKSHFTAVRKKNYTVFEVKGKSGSYIEQFVCSSIEEYEALEDDLDEKSEELVGRLTPLVTGGKTRYSTLIEVP
jgi:hypothetical protein